MRNRVLMLLENAPYLLDSRVRPEAISLVAAGYQVSVICPGLVTQRLFETVEGVHIYRYPVVFQGKGAVGYFFEYGYALVASFILSWVVLFSRGFDLIHAHNPPDIFVFIAVIFKLFGKKFVYDQHDVTPEMFLALFGDKHRSVQRMLVWMEQLSCRMADHVILANQSHQRITMQRSGIAQAKTTIVRNGPNLDEQPFVEAEPTALYPGKVVICYVGVMGYHDGVDYLLRALQHLAYDMGRMEFVCLMVGAGGAWQSMKSLSQTLELQDFVHFTGWIDRTKVNSYICAADICVAPEPSNPYNDRCTVIKIAEYMAMGKPVVAFDLPEHRVTAQSAALYARPNEEKDFAQKLAMLMDDPALRQKLGQIGKERVETELAWPHQVKNLLAAYATIGMRPNG
jgi:glycosyltransferase involved in cell wall biosynthesis